MTAPYPTSFAEIGNWAKLNQRPVVQARVRFAQYAVLWAVANSPQLGPTIVFKGGNALDFIWSPNRSTQDLDFSADMTLYQATTDIELRTLLTDALTRAAHTFNVEFRVQSLEQRPKGEGRTFITFQTKIGYALPDEQSNQLRIRRAEGVANVV